MTDHGVSYLTVEQISAEVGVSPHTVRRWFRRKVDPLPGSKRGSWRTTRHEFDAWITGPGAAHNHRESALRVDHATIDALPDTEPVVYAMVFYGIVNGTEDRDSTAVLYTADGIASLVASLMGLAAADPDFTPALMTHLSQQRPVEVPA